ncbi:MAG: signal peptidase [Acidobacteria bacterium]|nr:signal peptidase [Acidobacteriota bacterium]
MWTLFFGRHPRRALARAAVLVVAALILFGGVLLPVRGEGPSMSPTFEQGDLVFVNRLGYLRSSPARGDIVAVRLAGARVVYLKRIVGLPGERVGIAEGVVRVNGAPLDEPYVRKRRAWTTGEVTLGSDEYLVIGDNRGMAMGAHAFGKVRRARIVGPVVRLR